MIKAKVRLRNPNQGSAHNPNHTWIVLSGPESTILIIWLLHPLKISEYCFHFSQIAGQYVLGERGVSSETT